MKRLVLVGAGGIASRHVAALVPLEGVTIVGVCDIDEARARALAEKAGAPAFADVTRALDDTAPDYVAILTPRHVREDLVDLCLARRLPFFVEKPPCDRLSTGIRVRNKVNQAGLLHSVGFMHRWNEALNAVLAELRGEKLSLLTIRFLTPFATHPVVESYPGPYRVERSGGLVGDQGIHYLDLARYICGAEVRDIIAAGVNQVLPRSDTVTTVDAACWTLTMESEVLVHHAHTWGAAGWDCRLELVTDRSRVAVDLFGNRARGTVDGRDFRFDGTVAEFALQHRGFLSALAAGDMAPVRSTYADALRSFRLAAEINRILYGHSEELDAEDEASAVPGRARTG